MEKETPIASFFDGERQVDVLPPEEPQTKQTAELKGTRGKRVHPEAVNLSAEDREELMRQGRISPERLQPYLDPNLKESVEVFDLPNSKAPLLAFSNVGEDKAARLANFILAEGPLTYSEMVLHYSRNKELDKLDVLEREIEKRRLDADGLLFYHLMEK